MVARSVRSVRGRILARFGRTAQQRLYGRVLAKFGRIPRVGDIVCDCRFKHLSIVRFGSTVDDVTVGPDENGKLYECSLLHCCDQIDTHTIADHPSI